MSDEAQQRAMVVPEGESTQWLIAIFGAIITLAGLFVTVVMTIVVLYVNGKL